MTTLVTSGQPGGISGFLVGSHQATLFTPDEEVSAVKLLAAFLPRWAEKFNGEPVSLPVSDVIPRELPRLILTDRENAWRCEVSSGRINLYWRRTQSAGDPPSLVSFFSEATRFLVDYRNFQGARVGRLAAVVSRYVRMEHPGLFLSRHFCHERWHATPLNRPENLELHAHKRFKLAGQFEVNSWVRNKTGRESSSGEVREIILVEQDINTLAEDEPTANFTESDIASFFSAAPSELDHILNLYYPDTRS